jgi:type I restriction enzyme, S subunit
MSEWKEIELGAVAEIKTGPFGSALLNEQYIKGGTPIITVEHIKDFRISKLDYPSVTDDDKNRLSSYILEEGDLVFSRVGSVDLSAITLKENVGWLFSSRMLRVRPDRNEIDPLFLSYYLQLKSVRQYIRNIAVGSTMPSINTEILKSIPIQYCSLEEQTKIAKTLNNLDSKISLLRQQNETLEELAQTLFNQLLSEENQNCEVSLDQLADIGIGRTPPRKEDQWFSKSENDMKWISIKDMGLCGVYINNTSEYLTNEAVSKFCIPVIPKNTVVLSFKMTLGRVAITTDTMLSNEAIAHFKIKDESMISTEYLYFFLKTYKYQSLGSTSSIVTSINSGMIKNIDVAIPKKVNMLQFSNSVKPLFKIIKSNTDQVDTLSNLRDTLLPKLMSGEIVVKE